MAKQVQISLFVCLSVRSFVIEDFFLIVINKVHSGEILFHGGDFRKEVSLDNTVLCGLSNATVTTS